MKSLPKTYNAHDASHSVHAHRRHALNAASPKPSAMIIDRAPGAGEMAKKVNVILKMQPEQAVHYKSVMVFVLRPVPPRLFMIYLRTAKSLTKLSIQGLQNLSMPAL